MSSQLWELLISLNQSGSKVKLTCTECFAVIELLIEGAELGIDLKRLEAIAREHLLHCPGCREQIAERLGQLAQLLSEQ